MKKSIIAILFIMMITMFIISCEKTTEPENNDSEFATVTINLSTNNNGSVNGAVVKLQHNTNSGISQQKTVSSDMVSFTGMEYGTYTLTVTHAGYYVYSNSSLSVQSETVSQNVSLSEIPKATVNINLSTGNSGSVSGAVVKLQHNTNSNVSQQKTASGNLVSFTGVDYGSYTLTVTHSGYFIYSNTNLSVQSETVSQSVTLKDTYEIGETGPAGGIIFWDKGYVSDGWRYLEAAPATSEFNAEWGVSGKDLWEASTTLVGSGKANTQIINNKLQELGEVGRASQRCVALSIGGFKDWFLPSKDELNEMYRQKIGGFQDELYWSSSHRVNPSYNSAWCQHFGSGSQSTYDKTGTHRVRAVRAF